METVTEIEKGTIITPQERQEFDEFKRQKRVTEARAVIKKLELSLTNVQADRAQLRRALKDAEKLCLGGVCVSPYLVKPCRDFLGTASPLNIAASLSAWGGLDTTDIKVKQVKRALRDGANIVEVTAPIPAIKEGSWGYIKRELKKLRFASRKAILRINVEAPLLTSQELSKLCTLICDCKADAVRTASDIFGSGADEEDIKIIKIALKEKAVIKADGGDTAGMMSTLTDLGASVVGSSAACAVALSLLTAAERLQS